MSAKLRRFSEKVDLCPPVSFDLGWSSSLPESSCSLSSSQVFRLGILFSPYSGLKANYVSRNDANSWRSANFAWDKSLIFRVLITWEFYSVSLWDVCHDWTMRKMIDSTSHFSYKALVLFSTYHLRLNKKSDENKISSEREEHENDHGSFAGNDFAKESSHTHSKWDCILFTLKPSHPPEPRCNARENTSRKWMDQNSSENANNLNSSNRHQNAYLFMLTVAERVGRRLFQDFFVKQQASLFPRLT